MRSVFVKTTNAAAFAGALLGLQQRGAGEACLLVVDGEPGLGKTTTIQWWAVQNSAVFLRAKEKWTSIWLLRELLQALRKTPEHSFQRMYTQAIQALGERLAAANRNGLPFAIVIDEADYVSERKELMNTIRDLSDMLEVPVILVGMGKVRHNLTRFPQVASRVSQYVQFGLNSAEDTRKLVNELCDVKVAPELLDFLHKVSCGRNREIKEGIAAIERVGKRLGGVEIGLAQMAGQTLFNDRATGEPVQVRQ